MPDTRMGALVQHWHGTLPASASTGAAQSQDTFTAADSCQIANPDGRNVQWEAVGRENPQSTGTGDSFPACGCMRPCTFIFV